MLYSAGPGETGAPGVMHGPCSHVPRDAAHGAPHGGAHGSAAPRRHQLQHEQPALADNTNTAVTIINFLMTVYLPTKRNFIPCTV